MNAVWKRWRRLVWGVFFAVLAADIIFVAVYSPVYTATNIVTVDISDKDRAAVRASGGIIQDISYTRLSPFTYAEIINRPDFAALVADRIAESGETIEPGEIEGALSASVAEPEIIRIRARSPDPERAVFLSDAATETLMDYEHRRIFDEISTVVGFLEMESRRMQENIEAIEEARSGASAVDLGILAERKRVLVDMYGQVWASLTAARAELERRRIPLTRVSSAEETPAPIWPRSSVFMSGLVMAVVLSLGVLFAAEMLWPTDIKRATDTDISATG